VHVHEEDTAEGAVYRPADSDIPLSRRPREQLELDRNGSARVSTGGEDDRLSSREATWSEVKDTIVVRHSRGEEFQVVAASPERIVLRRRPGRSA
jgi:hypothetical protein